MSEQDECQLLKTAAPQSLLAFLWALEPIEEEFDEIPDVKPEPSDLL